MLCKCHVNTLSQPRLILVKEGKDQLVDHYDPIRVLVYRKVVDLERSMLADKTVVSDKRDNTS